jgi:hypothetical protein
LILLLIQRSTNQEAHTCTGGARRQGSFKAGLQQIFRWLWPLRAVRIDSDRQPKRLKAGLAGWFAMRGLVPGIHVLTALKQDVNGRD